MREHGDNRSTEITLTYYPVPFVPTEFSMLFPEEEDETRFKEDIEEERAMRKAQGLELLFL